jgi:hypothetical protein
MPLLCGLIAGTSTGRHPIGSSVAQISNALCQVFSAVEHLTLEHEVHSQSSEEHNDVDRIEWHNLLRSFGNVKTLRVEDGLVEELSRRLRLEDGELPLEHLPELQELTYSGSRNTGDAFTPFVDARQNAGRPVTLVRHSHSPSPSPSPSRYPLYHPRSRRRAVKLGMTSVPRSCVWVPVLRC